MNFFAAIEITDALLIAATALSPVIAVQVTRYLDEQKEVRNRKLLIFKTLMATRAYNVSHQHVEALNRIDLEFSPRKAKEKIVLDLWQQYLDHLGNRPEDRPDWGSRRLDLMVDLLHAMGNALGYDFSKTQIKNATYSPIAHGNLEAQSEQVRNMTLELLKGERSLPFHLTSLPENINQHQPRGEHVDG